MNKKKIKKIATWIIVPLMAAIFALDILTVALSNTYCRRYSVEQESFGVTAKSGTDLKMKSQIRPRRITIALLANIKCMNVILHGLRPVPINR